MSYEPRGTVKDIIDAMRTQAHDLEWSSEELAAAGGISRETISSTLRVAVREGAIFLEKRGRNAVYSLTSFEPEPVPEEFKAAYWSDGDVILYGLPELEDGGMLLSAENLAKLRRLVAWMPA